MSLALFLVCLLAGLIAVGVGELLGATPLPGWLVRILEYAVLLCAFVWLQTVLR